MYYYIDTYFKPSFTVHTYVLTYVYTYVRAWGNPGKTGYSGNMGNSYMQRIARTTVHTYGYYIHRLNYPSTKASCSLVHSLSGSITVHSV